MTITIQLNKKCRKCQIEKPLSDFTSAPRNIDKKASYCRPCNAAYVKALRDNQPRKPKIKKNHIGLRGYVWQLKTKALCERCGISYPNNPEAMEYDHLPQYKKEFNVSNPPYGTTDEKLKEEIAKCQILCACCHRIVTNERHSTIRDTSGNLNSVEAAKYFRESQEYYKEYNQVIKDATYAFIEKINKENDKKKESAEETPALSINDILKDITS